VESVQTINKKEYTNVLVEMALLESHVKFCQTIAPIRYVLAVNVSTQYRVPCVNVAPTKTMTKNNRNVFQATVHHMLELVDKASYVKTLQVDMFAIAHQVKFIIQMLSDVQTISAEKVTVDQQVVQIPIRRQIAAVHQDRNTTLTPSNAKTHVTLVHAHRMQGVQPH